MADITFTAPEYQPDQSLRNMPYRFVGDVDTGWRIERDGRPWLELGTGYVPVKTLFCGICATDLARHLLPFPLPQISGHEVVGEYNNRPVAIEINASHAARGIEDNDCVYCRNQLDSHCPERMTLGIDRLPGGFSPWVLAPVQAIHPLPADMSPQAGVLVEPFAAAVKAVETTPIQTGDKVAVLGPRRLGMLVIAALDSFRKIQHKQFEIVAVMRHPSLQQAARDLGADRVICLPPDGQDTLTKQFDIVFDTTGNPAGFERAVDMAKNMVHLKSTHGQTVMGLEHMTSLVINEQVLTGFTGQKVSDLLANGLERPGKRRIYVSPAVPQDKLTRLITSAEDVISTLDEGQAGYAPEQAFELAIVSTLDEINRLTRPVTIAGQGLLRAKGALLLAPSASSEWQSGLLKEISLGHMELTTSRCGSFARTMDLFRQCPGLAERLEKALLTQTMGLDRLAEAMALAAHSGKSIKVVVRTQ